LNKKLLGIGIIFFFLFSTLSQIGLGFNVKQSIENETLPTLSENTITQTVHQWPMFKHDPRHKGLSEYDTYDNPGVEKWKYFVEHSLHYTAVIDKDGILYIGDAFNGLYAVYPDGTMKWKIKIPTYFPHELLIGQDGTIYVGTDDRFYAYYSNGTLKWILNSGEKLFTGYPTIDSNGDVYVGTDDGYLYAVFPNSTIKWEYKINSWVAAPALDNQGNIYFTSGNGRLYCLNPDGTLKWNTEHLSAFQYGPVIGDDGTIYALPHIEYLYAFNPDGTLKWCRKDLPDAAGQVSIAPDGTLIICGQYENVVAIDPSDGDILWNYKVKDIGVSDDMTGAAIGSDGTIFFAYPKCMCALNPDGSLKWKEHLSTDYFPYDGMTIQFGTPSIGSDGTVYVTSWFYRGGSEYTDVGYIHAIGKGDPDAPSAPVISGKTKDLSTMDYEFSITATSPLGRDVYYQVDWSDRLSYTDWIGPYHSGETITLKHHWVDHVNYYQIAARAKDVNGLCGAWGEYNNDAPENPTINGPEKGEINTNYTYTAVTIDPDGDNVSYYFDWGDGTNSGWTSYVPSGESVSLVHSWQKNGYYIIEVKARDDYGYESDWAIFMVTMSKSKDANDLRSHGFYLLNLLEQFPLLNTLLYLIQ
jgi:outer membrane protein assembly factor BamB